MALNWNLSKCADHEELMTDATWRITDIMIWATMFVGIPEITESNYKEFYARLSLIERLNGTFLNLNGSPRYITLEEVERRVGLSTNAGTITRAQFTKQKVGNYFNKITQGE